MPDGTSVGGVPSALFQTLNANHPTATWEQQIEQAASLWENVTNANLALVSDGAAGRHLRATSKTTRGSATSASARFRCPSGVLAETFLPPPANGGTDAGDILLNSTVNWQINSNYDLMTVVAHEFGHALGLWVNRSVSTAVMYGTYNGIKQVARQRRHRRYPVDLRHAPVRSVQHRRPAQQHDITATNINSYISSNAQIAIPGWTSRRPANPSGSTSMCPPRPRER